MTYEIEKELASLKEILARHDSELKRLSAAQADGGDHSGEANVQRWLNELCAENARLRLQNEQLQRRIANLGKDMSAKR